MPQNSALITQAAVTGNSKTRTQHYGTAFIIFVLLICPAVFVARVHGKLTGTFTSRWNYVWLTLWPECFLVVIFAPLLFLKTTTLSKTAWLNALLYTALSVLMVGVILAISVPIHNLNDWIDGGKWRRESQHITRWFLAWGITLIVLSVGAAGALVTKQFLLNRTLTFASLLVILRALGVVLLGAGLLSTLKPLKTTLDHNYDLPASSDAPDWFSTFLPLTICTAISCSLLSIAFVLTQHRRVTQAEDALLKKLEKQRALFLAMYSIASVWLPWGFFVCAISQVSPGLVILCPSVHIGLNFILGIRKLFLAMMRADPCYYCTVGKKQTAVEDELMPVVSDNGPTPGNLQSSPVQSIGSPSPSKKTLGGATNPLEGLSEEV